ncbi:hypothetical protein CKO27_05040 [Thiocystis violacea]|nr:hypothetical protein [Thiocystis violacea]
MPDVSHEHRQAHASAVSWGAIVAGATAMAALSLILLILGTGLGLSAVSPWVRTGISATTFGVSTILWVTFTQLVASAMGGYLTGRLRTRWVGARADEVYFRDTAHGFLAWAVASLATAALLTSVIGSIIGNGHQAGGVVATAAIGSERATFGRDAGAMGYGVDSLFGADPNATGSVAAVPGAPLADATAATRDAADRARKASASASLWLFIALLSGAFIASLTAIFGGRQRDL